MPNNNINRLTINPTTYAELKARFCHDEGFDFNDIIQMPEYIYRGSLGQREKVLYGANNWYDWSVKYWGTKWNAYDIYWNDDACELSFYTAWSAPIPIMVKLSQMFPNNAFEWYCEDEGMDYCFEVTLLNGEEVAYRDRKPEWDEDEDEE